MQTATFFTETAKDVENLNLILQTAKNNNSATRFTNAQKAALDTAVTNSIDEINTMRAEIYAGQTPSITQTFAAYNDTLAPFVNVYTIVQANVEGPRVEFTEIVADAQYRYAKNVVDPIVDSMTNLVIVKSGAFLAAEAAAIVALAAVKAALVV